MTPKEFETTLSDAEVQLSRLKFLYEQWFQGIERIEPLIPRKQFDRMLHLLQKEQPRNTSLRFRFHTLIQRYTTLQTYWRRVARQIEEGTYRRDLLRVRRRREAFRAEREQQRRGSSSSPLELDPNQEVDLDELLAEASDRMDDLRRPPEPDATMDRLDLDQHDLTPSRGGVTPLNSPPARFARPQSRKPFPQSGGSDPAIGASRRVPPPIASRAMGPGDARLRQIYEAYVDAKRRNNERTDKIDYETVAKSLKRMVPKLDRKHRGKSIDFQVVVQDGKVGIKPVVKK
jgi:hypothetical protein